MLSEYKESRRQSIPELSSDNYCVKATMALTMALDKAVSQNWLDRLDEAVDSLWYPLITDLSTVSLLSQ